MDPAKSDVDAIAVFTSRQLYATHSIQALKAGKHVCSAVSVANRIDDLREMIQLVERNALFYMNGETSD